MSSRIGLLAAAALVVGGCGGCSASQGEKISRGYFGLHDHDKVVHVTSTNDFLACIWARNVETTPGGVQILTPASAFRGPGSTGPQDGLVLDVPAQTGMDLGCLGGRGNETFDISDAFGARVTIFVTVRTSPGATISMTRE
jgi:hypothetical protein